ncbi:hypothetical protein [Caulobacter sp. 602-1]|uniref:hypothetical protein n=1 Tax=Caulobacter sp. 602-1 TaxID=2492472 RepID=UPI000F62E820|nr:hypothetical protein [Caulobacter sp. 602-1]RRN64636.1 hypothetical protein EIK80_11415 [Caulobacter sp. 602-1]
MVAISLGLGLGLTPGKGGGVLPLFDQIAAAGDLMFAFRADNKGAREVSSGAVSSIPSTGAGFNPAAQATAGARPLAQTRYAQFDGVDDHLTQGNDRGTLTLASRYTIDNTNTGLAYLADGGVVSGDHGRLTGGEPSPTPGVRVYDLIGGVLVLRWQVTLASVGVASTASVQGVWVDPIDNTIYAMCYGTGIVIHLRADGSLIEKLTGFSLAGNGLTGDPSYPDCLVVGLNNSGVINWVRKSDKTVVKTVTLPQTPDQLEFNALKRWLEFTYGTDVVSGNVAAFALYNNALVGVKTSTVADCIEGSARRGSQRAINNDGGFHLGASGLNELMIFDETPFPTGAAPGSKFGIAWVGQIPSTKASTGAILAGGQGSLTSANTSGFDVLAPANSSTVQRAQLQNQNYDFATDLLGWHVHCLITDLTAKTMAYYLDGALQETKTLTTTIAYLTTQNWCLGAEHRSTGPTLFGKVNIGGAVGFINPDVWAARVMAELATI